MPPQAPYYVVCGPSVFAVQVKPCDVYEEPFATSDPGMTVSATE